MIGPTTLAALLIATPAFAQTPPRLLGSWGTEAQCNRLLHTPRGTVRAEPFRVSDGWLAHGALWCRLTFFPAQPRPDGLYATARASCGEDNVQTHMLAFDLAKGTLTLIWNESLINGPLARCAPP